MPQGVDDVISIVYDWITRVLYFVMSDSSQILSLWSLPLDNPVFESVYTEVVFSNDSNIFMTIAPFTGYADDLCILPLPTYYDFVLQSTGVCTG